MPKFSPESAAKLATADARLQRIFNEVIDQIDCTIICGIRNEKDQDTAFVRGHSKDRWPTSPHDHSPSRAIDAMPDPIDWENTEHIFFFAGIVLGTASKLGVKIRWGGEFKTLKDYDHFELDEP